MADEIRATPRNQLLGLLADTLQGGANFASKPFGYDNPPVRGLLDLMGVPAITNTLNELSYGGALGTGSGMTYRPKADTLDAAMAVAPFAPQAAAMAQRGLLATGKTLGPMAAQATENYLSRMGMMPGVVDGGKYAPGLNAKFGDRVDAYLIDSGDKTILSKIVVPKEARGQGVGTQFMQDLVLLADMDGRTLALSPSGDFGGNKNRLTQFYRQFGFVPNKGRFKDFSTMETMIRPPGYSAPNPVQQTERFVPSQEFLDAVGLQPGKVAADVGQLFIKHPEYFESPEAAKQFVQRGLLSAPDVVMPASEPRFTLTAKKVNDLPGGDAYEALVTDFTGDKQGYWVRSAHNMPEDQIVAKLKKSKK